MPLEPLRTGQDYIGTVYTPAGKRDVIPFDLNESPAVKDLVVQDHVWNQLGIVEKAKTVRGRVVVQQETHEYECVTEQFFHAHLDTFEKKLNAYMPMLEEHVERRLAFFFQQLVVCYRTHLHFEIGTTGDQQGGATALHIVDGQRQIHKILDRQAAHSSTIPCLVAYNAADWDRYRQNLAPAPQGFLFLNHSETFRNANATMEMMTEINQADSSMDGKANNPLLRREALDILNRASRGEIDPEQGLFLFMQAARGVIAGKRMGRGKEETKTILGHYHRVIHATEVRFRNDPTAFDKLLGVASSHLRGNQVLFQRACSIRYEAIRRSQMGESKLIERINTVKDQVLQQIPGRKTPDYFPYAFRAVLIESMPSEETRQAIEKLYAYPGEGVFLGLRRTDDRVTLIATTTTVIKTHALPLIRDLATELKLELYRLQREEILQRGEITRTLRNAHRWTQEGLAVRIKAAYPAFAASQPTISRIERNEKLIDRTYATGLSRVLQVDPGLFMPMFYYNERR